MISCVYPSSPIPPTQSAFQSTRGTHTSQMPAQVLRAHPLPSGLISLAQNIRSLHDSSMPQCPKTIITTPNILH